MIHFLGETVIAMFLIVVILFLAVIIKISVQALIKK